MAKFDQYLVKIIRYLAKLANFNRVIVEFNQHLAKLGHKWSSYSPDWSTKSDWMQHRVEIQHKNKMDDGRVAFKMGRNGPMKSNLLLKRIVPSIGRRAIGHNGTNYRPLSTKCSSVCLKFEEVSKHGPSNICQQIFALVSSPSASSAASSGPPSTRNSWRQHQWRDDTHTQKKRRRNAHNNKRRATKMKRGKYSCCSSLSFPFTRSLSVPLFRRLPLQMWGNNGNNGNTGRAFSFRIWRAPLHSSIIGSSWFSFWLISGDFEGQRPTRWQPEINAMKRRMKAEASAPEWRKPMGFYQKFLKIWFKSSNVYKTLVENWSNWFKIDLKTSRNLPVNWFV